MYMLWTNLLSESKLARSILWEPNVGLDPNLFYSTTRVSRTKKVKDLHTIHTAEVLSVVLTIINQL